MWTLGFVDSRLHRVETLHLARFCPIFSGLFMNSIEVIRRMALRPFEAYKLVNKFSWHNGRLLVMQISLLHNRKWNREDPRQGMGLEREQMEREIMQRNRIKKRNEIWSN